ncbi:MAG TPA: hypothetical protein VK866_16955 [Acidimicrobiales bacterium]|nr:hypothetical protein [Acidimicrobiales bacterium]
MATIRARCDQCGDVELRPHQVRVRLPDAGALGAYRFPCARCGEMVERPADEGTIALLRAAGVAVELPPTIVHEPRLDPVFTHDDLVAFHELVADDARLAAEVDHLRHRN